MTKETKTVVQEPKSFEEALNRLESLVKELEDGEVPLEKALAAFEEGQVLIKFCEKKLQAAEQTLKQLAKEAPEALNNSNT
jgi:exodeoxyribonuclease VII small subunit